MGIRATEETQEVRFEWRKEPSRRQRLVGRILDRFSYRTYNAGKIGKRVALPDGVTTEYSPGRVRPVDWFPEIPTLAFDLKTQNGRSLIHLFAREIDFDGTLETAPRGWEELQRMSNRQWKEHQGEAWKPNTVAPFWIHLHSDPGLRRSGLARRLVQNIATWAKEKGYTFLFFPALPSSRRTSKELVSMPFEEFACRRREDGLPEDPWFRTLVRCGLEVLGWCPTSHRFVTDGFGFKLQTSQQFPPDRTSAPILMDRRVGFFPDSWEYVSHFLEQDLYCWDWGCALMSRAL